MLDDAAFNRIFWHSRRGMLELDLVLLPFVEERLRHLEDVDVERFRHLLTLEDQDMFSWFINRVIPEDPEVKVIVDQIIEHAVSRDLGR